MPIMVNAGLEKMSQGVVWSQSEDKKSLHVALERMFETSPDVNAEEVKLVTERYFKYKRDYAKHLLFNPNSENHSKCFLFSKFDCYFDYCQLQRWSLHHYKLFTSILTRQPLTKSRGT